VGRDSRIMSAFWGAVILSVLAKDLGTKAALPSIRDPSRSTAQDDTSLRSEDVENLALISFASGAVSRLFPHCLPSSEWHVDHRNLAALFVALDEPMGVAAIFFD